MWFHRYGTRLSGEGGADPVATLPKEGKKQPTIQRVFQQLLQQKKNIGPGWANPPNASIKGYIVENQPTATSVEQKWNNNN